MEGPRAVPEMALPARDFRRCANHAMPIMAPENTGRAEADLVLHKLHAFKLVRDRCKSVSAARCRVRSRTVVPQRHPVPLARPAHRRGRVAAYPGFRDGHSIRSRSASASLAPIEVT